MANELNLRSDGSIDQTIMDFGKEFEAVEVEDDVITFSTSMIALAGEGDAADNLTTIANGGTGKMLLIAPADPENPVTIKHGVGNIVTGGTDIVLDTANMLALLIYNGSVWVTLAVGGGGEIAGSWCAELDFTSDDFDFADVAGDGDYISSVGWVAGGPGMVIARYTLTGDTLITRIEVDFNASDSSGVTIKLRLVKTGDDEEHSDASAASGERSFGANFDPVAATSIELEIISNPDTTVIHTARIFGLNTDPFGLDNCP